MFDDIISRKYTDFAGVDFSNNVVALNRSPFSVNMWKNYEDSNGKGIETRPEMKLIGELDNQIFNIIHFNLLGEMIVLVHCGTKLYKWVNYPNIPVDKEILFEGMNIRQSQHFIFDNVLFIKDGINYLEYDGITCREVEGTIPITSPNRKPNGEVISDNNDVIYQPVNVLTSLRINPFVADGESKEYHLNAINLDSATKYVCKAVVNGETKTELIDFDVDREKGIIKFYEVPPKPLEDGERNILITFSKTGLNYKERILKCNIMTEFDNRICFSGNQDYPNSWFHSELNDPRYVRDTAYYKDGIDLAPIKDLVPGNGVLWVLKEITQNTTGIYYHVPTVDGYTDSKIYPASTGNINLGCVSKGINFNDDIVFFSQRGLEGISGNINSEQLLAHRSSLVDSKLINEPNYTNVKLAEYKGFLLCLIDSKIYLADSRQKFQNKSGDIEYEWYYWEMPHNISFLKEYRGVLYLGNEEGKIFVLNDKYEGNEEIESIWTTLKDDFGYPAYTKAAIKRGNVANLKKLNNDEIKLSVIVGDKEKEKGIYSDTKGYITYKIKDKKFKTIQLKFSSKKPFGLFLCSLEAFVSGYVKR